LFVSDRETGILHSLQETIVSCAPALLGAADIVAELDCLLSLAASAVQNNYTRPILVARPVVQIRGGRHPLQELCVTSFVPNDTDLSDESTKIIYLTGPNASGKVLFFTALVHVK
jgi:DNA mismatch repair protein MSH5